MLTGNQNNEVGPSSRPIEELARESNKSFWEFDDLDGHERVDEAEVESENEAEAKSEDEAEVESEDEASGAAWDGADTTTSGVGLDGNATTDGEERKSSSVKRERRPNKVGVDKETITEVNISGHPTLPVKVARGHKNQLACILQDTVSIWEDNLRDSTKSHYIVTLLTKLRRRYGFSPDYNNQDMKTNLVNKAAITKMSTALASWRTRVKKMISEGKSPEEI
jgi:hypothetical protein